MPSCVAEHYARKARADGRNGRPFHRRAAWTLRPSLILRTNIVVRHRQRLDQPLRFRQARRDADNDDGRIVIERGTRSARIADDAQTWFYRQDAAVTTDRPIDDAVGRHLRTAAHGQCLADQRQRHGQQRERGHPHPATGRTAGTGTICKARALEAQAEDVPDGIGSIWAWRAPIATSARAYVFIRVASPTNETWAATMRQPSGVRIQVWLCRPRRGSPWRRNSQLAVPKSRP